MGQRATDQLRQIVIPDLLQRVGDLQTQRVSLQSLSTYLRRQQLYCDEAILQAMFDEADFRHEGSLAVGPLAAAIQGRYS